MLWNRFLFIYLIAVWNLNGKALDLESTRFVITNAETEFSLEIPVVLATDQGQYNVTISNDKGEITAAYSLHVDQSWKIKLNVFFYLYWIPLPLNLWFTTFFFLRVFLPFIKIYAWPSSSFLQDNHVSLMCACVNCWCLTKSWSKANTMTISLVKEIKY